MPINTIKIQEKLNSATIYINVLKKLNKLTITEFESDFESQLQAERIFEVLSQIILDVCTHIVSNTVNKPPNTYSECINKLVDLKILNKEHLMTFTNIIKMRNVIVHQYSSINLEYVFTALSSLIKDFKLFRNIILNWIEKNY